jgi:hypothetical protein
MYPWKRSTGPVRESCQCSTIQREIHVQLKCIWRAVVLALELALVPWVMSVEQPYESSYHRAHLYKTLGCGIESD